MSSGGVDAFLRANRKCHLGTVGPEGAPHQATVFYAMVDSHIAFWTYAKSQKVMNMVRDPRVSCLIESGWDYEQLQGVVIRGTAQILRDIDDVRTVAMTVAETVRGSGVDAARLRRIESQLGKRVAVLVRPEQVSSWDHGRERIREGATS